MSTARAAVHLLSGLKRHPCPETRVERQFNRVLFHVVK